MIRGEGAQFGKPDVIGTYRPKAPESMIQKWPEKVLDETQPHTTMASFARSASSSLRAASRRAPSALAKTAPKASYSLFARAAAAKVAHTAPALVNLIEHVSGPKKLISHFQGARGVKTLDFAGTKEVVSSAATGPG